MKRHVVYGFPAKHPCSMITYNEICNLPEVTSRLNLEIGQSVQKSG